MPGGIVQALKAHAKEVQALQGEQADGFLRMLRDTRESLYGRLSGYATGDEPFDVYRLRSVLAETETAIDLLERKARGAYRNTEKEALGLALNHLDEDLTRLSRTFGGEKLPVSIDALKVLADPAQELLAQTYAGSVKRYGLDLLNDVRRRLFIGLRSGDSFGQVVKEVAGAGGALGEGGQASAKRLARTEISHLYNATKQAAAKGQAKEENLVQVWIHLGSYNCPLCGPVHGTERAIGEKWQFSYTTKKGKTRKWQVEHPPAHPNCSCTTSIMKPAWRDRMLKLGYLQRQDPDKEESRDL